MLPEGITIPIIIGAALVDSINPCVFGVLIFLITFMTTMFKNKNKMLLFGILYTLVVYLTYFLIGLGILKFTVSFGFSYIAYWIAALIALIAGLLEIKDFFWYGRGISLQIIPGAAKRIKIYTHTLARLNKKHPLLLYLATIGLGIFVVLVELPCTGAPYLAVLGTLSAGNYLEGVPLLTLYNFVFILPLLVIIAITYFSVSSRKLENWRIKHRGIMRLVMGLFLIALGMLMVYTINRGGF